jgi:hypothetical protein
LGWRGIGDAVAALIGRSFHRRSNRHLHHRHADAKVCLMHRRKGTLGNGRYRLSVTSTQALLAENLRRGACGPLPGRSTVRESKAGFEPALPGRSIRHLHHQRWFEPRKDAANRNWIVAALSTARPRFASSRKSSLCHRCPAHRLVPSGRPRALRPRVSARAPGSGSPVPACAGQFSMSQRFGQQKTLRSSGSGGSANEQTAGPAFRQDPSHELGMRRRSAQSRSIV